MEVVDKTWYKELKDPATFYTNITALKLLDHLTKFYLGLHTVDAVDITQVMKTLFSDAEGIPKYINAMEAAHQKSKRSKFVIHDEYMNAVALKSLLQTGEYKTETQEWTKTPERPASLGGVEKRPSGRLTLQNDAPKPPRRGKKNPLVVPPYSELHLKRN